MLLLVGLSCPPAALTTYGRNDSPSNLVLEAHRGATRSNGEEIVAVSSQAQLRYAPGETQMAFIAYVPSTTLTPEDRVADPDNIIQIHAIHPPIMRHHYELYKQLMHRDGPLTRRERELLGVRVSALNRCQY
jgi:hypothetical protein